MRCACAPGVSDATCTPAFLVYASPASPASPASVGAVQEGQQLLEAGSINQSLLTLKRVINELSKNESKRQFVSYRDSKLTHILSPSLAGEFSCAMLQQQQHTMSAQVRAAATSSRCTRATTAHDTGTATTAHPPPRFHALHHDPLGSVLHFCCTLGSRGCRQHAHGYHLLRFSVGNVPSGDRVNTAVCCGRKESQDERGQE